MHFHVQFPKMVNLKLYAFSSFVFYLKSILSQLFHVLKPSYNSTRYTQYEKNQSECAKHFLKAKAIGMTLK